MLATYIVYPVGNIDGVWIDANDGTRLGRVVVRVSGYIGVYHHRLYVGLGYQ